LVSQQQLLGPFFHQKFVSKVTGSLCFPVLEIDCTIYFYVAKHTVASDAGVFFHPQLEEGLTLPLTVV
jgi:hypothetical protein